MEFCDSYSPHFIQQGMNSIHHARCYLSGLMGTQRHKNRFTREKLSRSAKFPKNKTRGFISW